MSIWLGIDLGQARVGLALSDPNMVLAHPAGNLQAYGDYFHVLDEVVDTILEHHVRVVVVGLPLQLDGTLGASAKNAQRWVKALHRTIEERIAQIQDGESIFDNFAGSNEFAESGQSVQSAEQSVAILRALTIILRDERLTTVTAHHQMSQSGLSMRKHRSGVDQQSAVVLLQSALDESHAQHAGGESVTPAYTEE